MSKKVKPGQIVKIINIKNKKILVLDVPSNTEISPSYFYGKPSKNIEISPIGIILRKIKKNDPFKKIIKIFNGISLKVSLERNIIIPPYVLETLSSTFYEVLCGDKKIIFTRENFYKSKL